MRKKYTLPNYPSQFTATAAHSPQGARPYGCSGPIFTLGQLTSQEELKITGETTALIDKPHPSSTQIACPRFRCSRQCASCLLSIPPSRSYVHSLHWMLALTTSAWPHPPQPATCPCDASTNPLSSTCFPPQFWGPMHVSHSRHIASSGRRTSLHGALQTRPHIRRPGNRRWSLSIVLFAAVAYIALCHLDFPNWIRSRTPSVAHKDRYLETHCVMASCTK